MRKKIFSLLLIVSVLPFLGIIAFLHSQTLNQQQELARRRLAMVISGVIGFYDRTGADILDQIQTLTGDDDLKRTLLLTNEIGFIDQAALIKSTEVRQNLLNLDYLTITDPQGIALAQGHDQAIFGISMLADPIVRKALDGQEIHSLAIRDIKGSSQLMAMAASPVWFKNRVIGVVMGGAIIDESYLRSLKALSGAELIMVRGGMVEASTISGNLDMVPIDTTRDKINSVELGGITYKFGAYALDDFSGEKIADLLIGVSTHDLKALFDKISFIFIIFAGAGFVLALILAWSFANKITNPIAELAEIASRLSTGDFDVVIKSSRKDEIGKLVKSFNSMAADLKDYREKLVNSERMAAFTQMAQKVAHEIKNPLTPIQVSIQDLKRSFDEKNEEFPQILEKSCATVLEEVASLARLVREFSEFARFPSPQLATENLNDLVAKFADLYTADIEHKRLVLDITQEKLIVNIDRDQIKRAVHNILKNAFEAAGETGRVELKTYRDKNLAVIKISDNGPGFSPQARKKLFSPYFTTKPDGSGLGLVIVKKIISEHEGFIEIEDQPGMGTTVKIKLRLQE